MDFWDWIWESRSQYLAAGDEERARLTEYWQRAFPFRETDPDQALALLREGCQLAEALGERWWAMMLHHWHLGALMFFKRDYRQVVELAVRNSVAASRPENAAFPGRWVVYRDLVSAYLGVDPEGYADAVHETLTYLDREIPAEPNESRYLMLGSLRQFHQERGDFEAAEPVLHRALALLQHGPDRHNGEYSLIFHYSGFCWMAAKQKKWSKLVELAVLGEEVARKFGQHLELCEFLMWQAGLARRDGDERRAQRLHSTAAAKMAGLRTPTEREYPDALALFHELGGDLDKALQVRERELAAILDHGRFAYECEVHLKRAALLAKRGLLQSGDLDAAGQAAQKLRKPERWLAEIDKLAVSPGDAH